SASSIPLARSSVSRGACSRPRNANVFPTPMAATEAAVELDKTGKTLRTPKISYGGQAVLEGVMMRGRSFMAVAVRAPDKNIVVRSEPLPKHLYGGVVQKIPLVRGMTMLWDALGLGMKALMFSADIQMSDPGADSAKDGKAGESASLSK